MIAVREAGPPTVREAWIDLRREGIGTSAAYQLTMGQTIKSMWMPPIDLTVRRERMPATVSGYEYLFRLTERDGRWFVEGMPNRNAAWELVEGPLGSTRFRLADIHLSRREDISRREVG